MIGGGASFTNFRSSKSRRCSRPLQFESSWRLSIFYNRRLSRAQYLGVQYQYAHIRTYPLNGVSETQIHSLLPFYTFYFNQAFSFSISAGVQRVDTSETGASRLQLVVAIRHCSVGWQGSRGNFAASFSHTVTAGGGLLGAYNSNSISASGGWKLARTWTGEVMAGYTSIDSLTPLNISSLQTGNTFTVSGSLQHSIGERFSASFQYQRLHENYAAIAVISANPDSNRESATITYQFRRPLGR